MEILALFIVDIHFFNNVAHQVIEIVDLLLELALVSEGLLAGSVLLVPELLLQTLLGG